MNTTLLRSLGFALPVLVLATAIHVEKDPSWGSWVDGILTGAWFAGLAALGAWAAARRIGSKRGVSGRAALPEVAGGALFGGLTWMLLWAAWKIPGADGLVGAAFGLNSAAFTMAGAVLAPVGARRAALRGSA